MGMYSYITSHNISVRPGMLGKLKQCLKKHRSKKKGYYYNLVEIKGKEISLEKLDGHKIISYWYEDFCKFLKDIAQYIEGEIVFEFETITESPVHLWFGNGKAQMYFPTWHAFTPEEMIRIEKETEAEAKKHYKFKSRAQVPKKKANRSAGSHKNKCPRCGRFVPKGIVTCCSCDYLTKEVRP